MRQSTSIYYFAALAGLVGADLRPYTGSFGVGLVDVEVPVQARNITSPTPNVTVTATGQPAFLLETVLFSIYYPAAKGASSTKAPHYWVPKPVDLVAQGFSKSIYANGTGNFELIRLGLESLIGNVTIPSAVDVPLADQPGPFPVYVFSHGDSSLPSWYSQYHGEIASRGIVVVAIGHRDGSGPATVINRQDGSSRNITYYTANQLSPALNANDFREQQRNFRVAEIEQVVEILRNITNGGGETIFKQNLRKEGEALTGFNKKLDFSQLVVGGHSFGGASSLQALQTSRDFPAKGSILLDPAISSGVVTQPTLNVPVVIADSEEWSSASAPSSSSGSNSGLFNTTRNVALAGLDHSKGSGSWFLTLLGTSHQSITDAALVAGPLLSSFTRGGFNATIAAFDGIFQPVKISVEFFDFLKNGSRSGVLAAGVTHPQFNVANQTVLDATPQDIKQFWQIHVGPPANTTNTSGNKNSASGSSVHFWLLPLTFAIAFSLM